MRFDVAIPDLCHLRDVSRGEVAALYAEMVLALDAKPRVRHIVCEGPDGGPDNRTILYLHPETDEVLMQVNVNIEKSQKGG